MENKKIVIDGILFRSLYMLAKKEFEYWETINKNKGRKQCFNRIESCLVGVLGEKIALIHLQRKRKEDIKEEKQLGFLERKTKKYNQKSDISFKDNKNNKYNIEVKSINSGKNQQKGQILPYHVNKYIKNKIDFVFFVELDYNIDKEYCEGSVYLVTKPEDILNWEKETNKYKKMCYTYKKYLRGNNE